MLAMTTLNKNLYTTYSPELRDMNANLYKYCVHISLHTTSN